MEYVRDLEPRFDNAKSFYKKAKIYRDEKGKLYLKSYNTIVAEITDEMVTSKPTYKVYGWYSSTTSRHINDFLLQYNVIERKLSKKEMEVL